MSWSSRAEMWTRNQFFLPAYWKDYRMLFGMTHNYQFRHKVHADRWSCMCCMHALCSGFSENESDGHMLHSPHKEWKIELPGVRENGIIACTQKHSPWELDWRGRRVLESISQGDHLFSENLLESSSYGIIAASQGVNLQFFLDCKDIAWLNH